MKIMAIDPGTTQSAYVVFDGKTIFAKGIEQNNRVKDLIGYKSEWFISALAIEAIASYGMPVGAEVFTTCIWIGRFYEAASRLLLPVSLVYRKDIKVCLCGSLRAKDSHVRQALIDRVGKQGIKKAPGPTYGMSADMWSALAVAVYFLDTRIKELR